MEVVGIDVAGGIDLQAVVVLVGVLEEAVHGVQHLVGHGEKPFTRHSPVVQPLLPLQVEKEVSSVLHHQGRGVLRSSSRPSSPVELSQE